MKKSLQAKLNKQFCTTITIGFLCFCLSTLFTKLNAQIRWYYNGTGAINNVASWGTNLNGSGGSLADFTSGGRYFIIQNTTNVSLSGTWVVGNTNFASAGGDSIIIGNHTSPVAPITLTLMAGSSLTVNKSRTIAVAAPLSGNNKIIYQNSTVLSLGDIADAALELVFDATTISTSSSSTFGDVSLINNATVNMSAASMVIRNLTVSAGSTLIGPIGASSNYIAIRSGGVVVIDGTFRAGRSGTVTSLGGGFYSTGVAIPVTPTTTFATLLFQDAATTPAITLGNASTIDYYRGTSSQTGTQGIAPMAYANLTLSNSTTTSNKSFAIAGTISVSGILTINLVGLAIITAPSNTTNINLLPNARLVISSATALPTNNKLTLQSDATGTASISTLASGASIVGNVTVQQYIPGLFRNYRFISHPFTTNQPLTQLSDNIDITGNTAGTNLNTAQTVGFGFTPTSTNNPSAYYFNTSLANGNINNDAGWVAFTADTSTIWSPGMGIRLLVRGTKSQSSTLNGTVTSPNAVTLDLSGTVNTGNVAVNLAVGGTGTASGFNLVGNPYPSPVNIGAVLSAATNIGSTIYLRNPSTASYITVNPIPANYILPAYTAFFVKANAATTLNFSETHKTTCTSCPLVFRNKNVERVEFEVLKDGDIYDNLIINFTNITSSNKDDGIKLLNSGLNLYTFEDNKTKFSAINKSLKKGNVKLGLSIPATNKANTYTLKVANFNLPNNSKLVLFDRFTNTYTTLNEGTTYNLFIDPLNPLTVGEKRLEILIKN